MREMILCTTGLTRGKASEALYLDQQSSDYSDLLLEMPRYRYLLETVLFDFSETNY